MCMASPRALSPAMQTSWAGQGSGHCPKLRGAVVYDPSPGYFPQQRRPLGPDKAAGTARLGLPRGGKGLRFWQDYAAWPARHYTAPGLLRWVRKLGSLWAGPAREKAGEELG